MIGAARDIVAAIALDRRLGLLRERQMEMLLAGEALPGNFWVAGQREITEFLRGRFYRQDIRVALLGEAERGRNDEQAWDEREQKLAEFAILLTHRILAGTPCVGDRAYQDDD
jgi:hypothetical protein